jgi:hypothetical protein
MVHSVLADDDSYGVFGTLKHTDSYIRNNNRRINLENCKNLQYLWLVAEYDYQFMWLVEDLFLYGKSVARGAFPPFFDLMAPKIHYQ